MGTTRGRCSRRRSIERSIERGGERATGGRVDIDIDIDIAGGVRERRKIPIRRHEDAHATRDGDCGRRERRWGWAPA